MISGNGTEKLFTTRSEILGLEASTDTNSTVTNLVKTIFPTSCFLHSSSKRSLLFAYNSFLAKTKKICESNLGSLYVEVNKENTQTQRDAR